MEAQRAGLDILPGGNHGDEQNVAFISPRQVGGADVGVGERAARPVPTPQAVVPAGAVVIALAGQTLYVVEAAPQRDLVGEDRVEVVHDPVQGRRRRHLLGGRGTN